MTENSTTPNIILKRLKREKPSIIEKYNNYEMVEYDCPDILNTKKYPVGVRVKIDKNLLEIKLSDAYPFHPPKLFINNMHYRDMLHMQIPYIQDKLNKMGIYCLCCKSILCPNFWNPAKKILDILNEFDENKNLLSKIIRAHYVEKVCHSKNIYDTLIINKINSFFL